MKPTAGLVFCLTLVAFAVIVDTARLSARPQFAATELSLGVEAYKQSKYEEAAQHFQKAVVQEPENPNAHLYLATVYARQYIPGVATPDNAAAGESAIEQYELVLNCNPSTQQKLNSVKGMAYLYLNMKKFDDARRYYRLAADIDRDDPTSYYSIGVIDWTESYQTRMSERANLDLRPERYLNPLNKAQRQVCDELKSQNWPVILDGIDILNHAIQLRPDYDDAMAYLNLMYREKADVECDDLAGRKTDLATADHWVDKTLAVKKMKAERAAEPRPAERKW